MFTIGCDPELFLFDNLLQRIVPAVGKIGGSKLKPMRLSKGTVQLDGTVVEIGTDPASTAEGWIDNVQSVINEVQAKLDARFHGRYSLRCGAIAGYAEEDITFSRTAFEVGCEPAYKFDGNELVRTSNTGDLSPSAIPIGGHIHIGFGCNLDVTDPVLVQSVKRYTRFVNSRLHEPVSGPVADRIRETGCLNSLRIKPYGVEMREWSSYWLADRELMVSIFTKYKRAYEVMCQGKTPLVEVIQAGTALRKLYYKGVCKHIEQLPAKYQKTLPLDF